MTPPKEYLTTVQNLMSDYIDGNEVAVYFETPEEAKQHLKIIRYKQKRLRLIKKDVRQTMTLIRSSFTAQKAEVGKPGIKTGIMAGLLGKKSVGKINALTKENLRRQQNESLAPYKSVLQIIENFLLNLDSLKLQIESWLFENR